MTTTTEPGVQPNDSRRPSARLRFSVAFLIGLILTLGLGVGAMYAYDQQYAGRVLPGVQVGSVDVSGLSAEAARTKLLGAYGGLSDGRIVIVGPDGQHVISYAEIGRGLDADGLVDEAMAVGRDGTAIDRAVANARTALDGATLTPRVTFDQQGLSDRIAAIAAGLNVASAEASVATDTELAYTVVPGHSGRSVDPLAATEAVSLAVAQLDAPPEVTATLQTTTTEPVVTTDAATRAKADAERIAADVHLVVGDKKVSIDTSRLRPLISFEPSADGTYAPVVDATRVVGLLDGMAKKIDRKAVSATFRTSGTKVTGIVDSRTGHTLDVPATARQIEALLAARAIGGASAEIRPALTVTEPVLTTAEAKAAAPRMRKISSWTTYFPIWERNGFGANIWIPALTIDGYVVGPREKFDFWKAVGSVTRAKGYKQGGAIINGKTEPQGALAGGICSCSTTLFNAALRGGYQMDARRNHFYYIDRYPVGLDATVAISGSSVTTMSWTNDTDYPVLIRGYKIRKGSSGYVRFELYSVPTGRIVKIGPAVIKNVRQAGDSIQYTSSLAPGARKRIETPTDGMQVWRTVTVTDKRGKVIRSTTYYSNYARITGVVLVGRGEAVAVP
jgi:vancomycin resistance protein YoaR